MSEDQDREYYTRRAKEELLKAVTSNDDSAASAHFHMASEYQRRVANDAGTRVTSV